MTAVDRGAEGEHLVPPPNDRSKGFGFVEEMAWYELREGHPIRVRPVFGQRITFGILELNPGLHIPSHSSPSEQVGIVVQGEVKLTIDGVTRVCGPGDWWIIPANVPDTIESVGPEGCTIIEAFSPPREDWVDMPRHAPAPGNWRPAASGGVPSTD
jgi:quercetin dioxygenase-like cupin family protein